MDLNLKIIQCSKIREFLVRSPVTAHFCPAVLYKNNSNMSIKIMFNFKYPYIQKKTGNMETKLDVVRLDIITCV